MSTDGQNVLQLFRQAREVCEQVSLLLKNADEFMRKAGWETDNSNSLSDFSYSLQNPRQWIPTSVFSFYYNKKFPANLACISVILCDHFDDRFKLTEPIVVAYRFDYIAKGEKVHCDYEYWYARYFGFLSIHQELEANSQLVKFDNRPLEQDLSVNFEKGTMFAVPLVSLKNAQDVKKHVADKLLSLLTKA
jgi:hypothetical protein